MKKVILIILVVVIFAIATGCAVSHRVEDGKEIYCDFVFIKDLGNMTHVCYDPETNVCYAVIWNRSTNGYGITPYYTMKNGEPVIAVYGKNYKVEEPNTFGDK